MESRAAGRTSSALRAGMMTDTRCASGESDAGARECGSTRGGPGGAARVPRASRASMVLLPVIAGAPGSLFRFRLGNPEISESCSRVGRIVAGNRHGSGTFSAGRARSVAALAMHRAVASGPCGIGPGYRIRRGFVTIRPCRPDSPSRNLNNSGECRKTRHFKITFTRTCATIGCGWPGFPASPRLRTRSRRHRLR